VAVPATNVRIVHFELVFGANSINLDTLDESKPAPDCPYL
jgi:hypothetical protein